MNTNTTKRHPRRTDDEWLKLIQACRTSGLSDKQWCLENNICPSKLYYHIRRLTKKACADQIPGNPRAVSQEKHEIVQLRVSDDLPVTTSDFSTTGYQTNDQAALRLSFRDISLEIFNHAEKTTIQDTLLALQMLC